MRIIVNHLTRMQPGYMCTAGVDVTTGEHVRPVLQGRLRTELLVRHGGFIDMASLIDLGPVEHCGAAPELEDYRFDLRRASAVSLVAAPHFWALLQRVAQTRLGVIFGPDLKRDGQGCTVDPGGGVASLGCLIPAGRPDLHVKVGPDGRDSIRLTYGDGELSVSSSVTDIRLYESDLVTPKRALVADIRKRLADGVPCVLSVGLTRLWTKPGDSAERHWLQVNNIHLEDNPAWRLV
jgi:hypothetical protein